MAVGVREVPEVLDGGVPADAVGGWVAATAAGTAAGLGVAVPLGAVGVLLVQEAVTRGRRHGLAAAAGVAVTDLVYAVVAVVAGGAVAAWTAPHEQAARAVAAVVLAGTAVRGIHAARRSGRAVRGEPPTPTPRGPRVPSVPPAPHGRTAATAARFAAVTLVNPATVVAFSVVVAGLGGSLGTGVERAAFAVGVLAGSAVWHGVLALTAASVGRRLGPRVRVATGVAGHGIVLLLAAGLVLTG